MSTAAGATTAGFVFFGSRGSRVPRSSSISRPAMPAATASPPSSMARRRSRTGGTVRLRALPVIVDAGTAVTASSGWAGRRSGVEAASSGPPRSMTARAFSKSACSSSMLACRFSGAFDSPRSSTVSSGRGSRG